MKQQLQKFCAVLCCLALLASTPSVLAAPASVHAAAWLRPVYVDGQRTEFANAEGQYTYLFSSGDITYMPANTAAQWLGCKLSVNLAGKTAAFTSGAEVQVPGPNSTPVLVAAEQQRLDRYFTQGATAQLLTDFTVTVDDKPWSFASGGASIAPFLVEGTLYLPLRAVGERMGKIVTWVPAPQSVDYREAFISIDARPTQTQLDEMQSYLDQGLQLYGKAAALGQRFTAADRMPAGKAVETLEQIKGLIQQIGKLPAPSHHFLDKFEIPAFASSMIAFTSIDDAVQSLRSGAVSLQELQGKGFSGQLNTTLSGRYRTLDEAQQALNVLAAAQGGA